MRVDVKSKKVIHGLNRTMEGVWLSMHFDVWTWGSPKVKDWDMPKVTGLIDAEDQVFYVLPDGKHVSAIEIMETATCFGRDKMDGTPSYFCELSSDGGIVVDSFVKNGKLDGLALDANSDIVRHNADVGSILQRNENLWEKYR